MFYLFYFLNLSKFFGFLFPFFKLTCYSIPSEFFSYFFAFGPGFFLPYYFPFHVSGTKKPPLNRFHLLLLFISSACFSGSALIARYDSRRLPLLYSSTFSHSSGAFSLSAAFIFYLYSSGWILWKQGHPFIVFSQPRRLHSSGSLGSILLTIW